MKMKRLAAFGLSLALAGGLSMPALADNGQLPGQETASPSAHYMGTLVVNGKTLDTAALPAAPAYDMLPLRLIAEADYGGAYWDEETNRSSFYLDDHIISVDFSDNSITVDGDMVLEEPAAVVEGVTFVPPGAVDALEGYAVDLNLELDVNRIDISTPNGAPLLQLAYQIIEETGMARGMKTSVEDAAEFLGIQTENFSELVAFTPMMISSDTVIIGKLAEDGDRDQAIADLEARQETLIASFENYLPDPLERAQNGKIVEHNGWLMLIISPDTEKAIALFEAAVDGM